MKNLYYGETGVQADKELVEMIKAFKNDPRFEILDSPTECLVHQMKGNNEVGKHIGYEFHWVVVKCWTNGNVYHINKAQLYLLEGKWNVTVFIENQGYEQQALYPFEYMGLEDLCIRPTVNSVGIDGTPRRKILRLNPPKEWY